MALEMRPKCERCEAALVPEGPAFICSFEWASCCASLPRPLGGNAGRHELLGERAHQASLLDGKCNVGPMTECLGLPQAYVSRHLAILRRAGIVAQVPEGRLRVYRVVHPRIRPLIDVLTSTGAAR